MLAIPDIFKHYSTLIKYYVFMCSMLKELFLLPTDHKHI